MDGLVGHNIRGAVLLKKSDFYSTLSTVVKNGMGSRINISC